VYDPVVAAEPTAEDPQKHAMQHLAGLTPAQLTADIRAAMAHLSLAVETWHRSPRWRDDTCDRRAYETVLAATAQLNGLPEPDDHRGVRRLAEAVSPILNLWWPDRPGPEHDVAEAVEWLRRAALARPRWAEDARRMLGEGS
jgi:hypothetical protein